MMLHLEWKPKYGYKMFKKEEQKNLKDLPNNKLVEFMDLLSSDFELTKQSIITSTIYLDKVEELYNNVLNVYQDRNNGR
jgi:hypothetical protein